MRDPIDGEVAVPEHRASHPLDVGDLLAHERAALLDLLEGLTPSELALPTSCPAWSVHELSVHLVHDDLRRLAADRDGHEGPWIEAASLDELVAELSELNERWVATMAPTLSPRLVVELLAWLDEPTRAHLLSLDPDAPGAEVAWAGPGPHPNRLDVAREYTERWVHQQQLRDAVERPGLDTPRFMGPVLEAFAFALPAALGVPRPGARVLVEVVDGLDRGWLLASDEAGWRPPTEPDDRRVDARVRLPAAAFWRRAVRILDRAQAHALARVEGDLDLGARVLDVRAAIVADDAPSAGSPRA